MLGSAGDGERYGLLHASGWYDGRIDRVGFVNGGWIKGGLQELLQVCTDLRVEQTSLHLAVTLAPRTKSFSLLELYNRTERIRLQSHRLYS